MESLLLAELMLEFDLRAFQSRALRFRQRLAGAVDIEGQHRQRRAIGAALAARTVLRRTLQRCRDLFRTGQFEDALLEIERVAFLCHALRPAFRGSLLGSCRPTVRLARHRLSGMPGFTAFGHRQLLFNPKRWNFGSVPMPQCGNPRWARALSSVAGIPFAARLGMRTLDATRPGVCLIDLVRWICS